MTDEELIAAMRAAFGRRGVIADMQIVHPMRRLEITLLGGNRAVELAIYDAELDLIEAGIDDVAFDLKVVS